MSLLSDEERILRILTERNVSPLCLSVEEAQSSFYDEKTRELVTYVGGMFFEDPSM